MKATMIAGLILFAIGVIPFGLSFTTPTETNLMWWTEVVATMGGGAVLMAWPQLSTLLSKVKSKTTVNKPFVVNQVPGLDSTQEIDIQCINHVANRMKEIQNTEGLGHCLKLQEIFFSLYYNFEDKQNDVTKT